MQSTQTAESSVHVYLVSPTGGEKWVKAFSNISQEEAIQVKNDLIRQWESLDAEKRSECDLLCIIYSSLMDEVGSEYRTNLLKESK